jgi:hypothetical protein
MPAAYNLVAPQATTFNFQFQIATGGTPWDLNGYTGTMTVRPYLGTSAVTLQATTANGKLVMDKPNGRITVTFSATDTDIKAESYVYDLVLYASGIVTRILEGQFIVTAGVTV